MEEEINIDNLKEVKIGRSDKFWVFDEIRETNKFNKENGYSGIELEKCTKILKEEIYW